MTQQHSAREGTSADAVPAPPSLYVVALYQLIGAAVALYTLVTAYGPGVPEYQRLARLSVSHSLPYSVLMTAGVINGLAGILIGVGIFARWAWVRPLFALVFLETTVVSLLDNKANDPFGFLAVGAVFCISLYILFLLYRDPATRYFTGRER